MTQTTRRLRSVFEPGSTPWAMRRAQWLGIGLSEEDLDKPKIAVVNSSSKLASCFSHLDDIAARIAEVIRAAGAVPFEVRTAAPSDAITSAARGGQYILPSRDLIANDIEVAVEGALLDGMVCLASCDKTTPGQLMAAGRLNIPTLVVACGYQPSGTFRGEHVDFEDVFLYAGHVATGKMTVEELAEMSACAITGPGVCAGLGTANSMHMAAEALGMALPGSTPVLANSEAMWRTVEAAGRRIVEMVDEDLRPRDVLTPGAFRNAVALVLAISGSVNTMKHLQAIAAEAGCDADVYGLFERLAPEIPLIVGVKPNGDRTVDELEAAGGTLGVLRQLRSLVELSERNVVGRRLGELVEAATVADEEVIRPVDRPLARHPGIVLVRGSLAPDGGIVKRTIADDAIHRFGGPAKVYHAREDAIAGIRSGEVKPGDVLVVSGLGPVGSPGMGMTSAVVFALDGAGLGEQVIVVTDGQLSGLVNKGLVVGEVSPEGATGGPIGLVEDGDRIEVDVDARAIELVVPDEVLDARREARGAAVPVAGCSWLSQYARAVRPLIEGATLGG